jgi:hypothetical protein
MLIWKTSTGKWSNGIAGFTGSVMFCKIFYDALQSRDSKEKYRLTMFFPGMDESTHGEKIDDLKTLAEDCFNRWLDMAGLVQG